MIAVRVWQISNPNSFVGASLYFLPTGFYVTLENNKGQGLPDYFKLIMIVQNWQTSCLSILVVHHF